MQAVEFGHHFGCALVLRVVISSRLKQFSKPALWEETGGVSRWTAVGTRGEEFLDAVPGDIHWRG
jgi:hypothetical protein